MSNNVIAPTLTYTIGLATDVGQQRSHNEDTASIIDVPGTQAAFVLCDGMGGLRAGDVASRQAVRTVATTLQKRFAVLTPTDPLVELRTAFVRANDAVNGLHTGEEFGDGADDDAPTERPASGPPSNALMGTTCVAGIVRDETLFLAHAGDSRAYLYREGALSRLTDDHSYVAERVRAGDITEAEAKVSRFRNMITRAIGIEPTVNPELRQEPLRSDDIILVCSDGLTNMIDDAKIADILRANPSDRVSADRVAQTLTDAANRAGGSDNITVVLLRVGGIGDAPAKVAASMTLPTAPVVAPPPPTKAPITAPAPAAKPAVSKPLPSKSGGGIVDIDAPASSWKPRGGSGFSVGSLILGVGLALGLAILVFTLSPDARRETARVLRGQTPLEATNEQQNLTRIARDYRGLAYDAPVRFSDVSARADVLAFSRESGLLCAGADSGAMMALAPGTGKPTPIAALPILPPVPLPLANSTARVYLATDPSGDVYLSSQKTKTIEKRGPDGTLLQTLKGFERPQAIALDDEGNLYVVDVNLVKVLHAHPATAKSTAAAPTVAAPTAEPTVAPTANATPFADHRGNDPANPVPPRKKP